MILGNSNGNNRGKKYIMRGKHDQTPCEGGEERALKFKQWFEQHFDSLVRELIHKELYDCDVMNDTYLRMYENLMYGGAEIDNYRSYFIRSVFTNVIQGNVKASRYVSLTPSYDAVDGERYNHELERKQIVLSEDIFDYVYNRYKIREFELFKMYVSLKPAVNYQVLADITKLKAYQIQGTISKIKKDICRNRDFVKRRKEVLS